MQHSPALGMERHCGSGAVGCCNIEVLVQDRGNGWEGPRAVRLVASLATRTEVRAQLRVPQARRRSCCYGRAHTSRHGGVTRSVFGTDSRSETRTWDLLAGYTVGDRQSAIGLQRRMCMTCDVTQCLPRTDPRTEQLKAKLGRDESSQVRSVSSAISSNRRPRSASRAPLSSTQSVSANSR